MTKITAGIDFGTSNSLVAVAHSENDIQPVNIYGKESVIPTTLFFGNEVQYGKPAINSYLYGTPGRFMRGIKSLLDSKTETDGTYIDGRFVSFSNLIKQFIQYMKTQAEKKIDANLEDVVMGRPVHFDDNPTEDKAAEQTLQKICYQLGFKNVSFQYEPIAAALHYEQRIQKEELTLVADLGGGTSDFSVIRLSPDVSRKTDRTSDILSNDSVHVAGTDLDHDISFNIVMPHFGKNGYRKNGLPIPYSFFADACVWHNIRKLYTPLYLTECENMLREVQQPELFSRYVSMIEGKKGHYMLFEVEGAKISLSQRDKTEMDLSEIDPTLYLSMNKDEFLSSTQTVRNKIISKAKETITNSGIKPNKIQNLIFTGGTSLVPAISQEIQNLCPNAQVRKISTFSAVGSGLALESFRRYGRER